MADYSREEDEYTAEHGEWGCSYGNDAWLEADKEAARRRLEEDNY